jgi:DNA-binding MarR family transcriptional regulator
MDEFLLDEFLPHRLSVASDGVSRLMVRDHLGPSGLAITEWRLLAVLGRHGLLSPSLVGEYAAMDKVKVSRAATSLVKRGLLRQGRDPHDGRGRLLHLTRKGKTIYTRIAPMAREIETAVSAGLTGTEWKVLHAALGKLVEHTRGLLNDGAPGHE